MAAYFRVSINRGEEQIKDKEGSTAPSNELYMYTQKPFFIM